MKNGFRGFETRFGIDLGTSTTTIYRQGKGVVLKEPSVLALNKETGQVEAVGEEARAMVGRTPQNLQVVYPLKDGVVSSFDLTTEMLRHFIRRIEGRMPWFSGIAAYISVPCGITNVQKRAVMSAVMHKGAKKVVIVEEPLAAAIGAGLPVDEPTGSMVLGIGGGTIQAAVISMGGIAGSCFIKKGSLFIDEEIMEYLKKTYRLAIGEPTAEKIKRQIGSALHREARSSMEVRGRDLVTGLPSTVTLTSGEIGGLLEEFIASAVEAVRMTLEQVSPELAGDVMERGITLCGGGSLLHGLDARLAQEVGIPVIYAEEPEDCAALGTGRMLGDERPQQSIHRRLFGRIPVEQPAEPESDAVPAMK